MKTKIDMEEHWRICYTSAAEAIAFLKKENKELKDKLCICKTQLELLGRVIEDGNEAG